MRTSVHCLFFNDTATTEIYTLSLHDALPISRRATAGAAWRRDARRSTRRTRPPRSRSVRRAVARARAPPRRPPRRPRSEEHTSELQSRQYLVCRLLLEKKKTYTTLSHLQCSP